MAYGTKYRLQFTNHLQEDYYIFLQLKNYVGDIEFITTTAGGLVIKSLNSDDDRFSPILSKEAVITMHIPQGQNVSIKNFLATEDDQWLVVIWRELAAPPIFTGFIVVEESSQPLLDAPFQLNLRASDGLALLKNVELKTIQGNNFEGLVNITDYLGAILFYLNSGINFRVYYDIYHIEMMTNLCALEQMQLDAGTFSKDENTFQDAYTVLERICTDLQCRIFYENGLWHIVSLWQYHKDYGFNYIEYTTAPGYVLIQKYVNNDVIVAKIGKDEVIYPVNKDSVIYYKLANKSVRKQYDYIVPSELVKNQQFKIGTKIPELSGSFLDTSSVPNQTIFYDGYSLNGWDQQRGVVVVGSPLINRAYIRRERDIYDYERDRFLVMPTQSSAPTTIFVLSSQFPIGASDKINISIDSKIKKGYSGAQTSLVFAVLLRGDNGTFYSLDDNTTSNNITIPGKWYVAGNNFSSGLRVIQRSFASGEDKTEWVTTTVNSNGAPTSGTIQIVLYEQSGDQYPNETWYKNLRIEYKPYIKGGYAAVKGDYNIFSQDQKINRTLDEPVYISDAPKKIIKGAIFVNRKLASPEWKLPGRDTKYRFTQAMALIKYNFLYRQFHKIEGTLKGLSLFNTSQDNIPFGFLPQYSFSDIPNQPATKYILTSMDINYVSGTWRGVLVEVQVNSSETFSKYDFQYLFE